MSLNEHYFKKASAQLEQRRSANGNMEIRRRAEVIGKIPEYARLEELLADTSQKLIKLMLQNGPDREEKLAQLEKGNLSIQQSMDALLVQGGFPADYLDRIYTCPKCRDRGTIGGEWCECFRRLMLDAAAEELNSVSPLSLSDFDSFSLDYYSEQGDPALGGISPRMIMEQNLEYCKGYADSFTKKSGGILMSGGTGLGKTHLSLAVADAVIKKGYNVIYCSVPELLRIIEREHYRKWDHSRDNDISDDGVMNSVTECDLLILDDLGAEVDKPLYTSFLYEIINARTNRKLPMIVSTNLGMNDLNARYQDRIGSRIFCFKGLVFAGTDIRKLKKFN